MDNNNDNNNGNVDPNQVIADINEANSSTDFVEFDNNNNNGFVDFDNFDANISTKINDDGAGFVEFDSFNADTAVTTNFDFDFTPTKLNSNIDNEINTNNDVGISTSLFSPSSSYDTMAKTFSPTVDHSEANAEINVDDNNISNDTNTSITDKEVSNNNGIIYVSNEDDNSNYEDGITVVDDPEVSTSNNQNDQVQPQSIYNNISTSDDLDVNINDNNTPPSNVASVDSDESNENNNNFNDTYDDQNSINDNKDGINNIDTNNATPAMEYIPNVDTNVENTTKETKISTDTTNTINNNKNAKSISNTNDNASNVFIPIPSSPRRPSPSSISAPTIKDKLRVDLFQEDASILDSKTSSINNPKEKLSLDLYAETTNEATNISPDDEVDDEINLINRAKIRKTLSLSILVSEELVSINKEQGNFIYLTTTIGILTNSNTFSITNKET